jgi:hypothetical protein
MNFLILLLLLCLIGPVGGVLQIVTLLLVSLAPYNIPILLILCNYLTLLCSYFLLYAYRVVLLSIKLLITCKKNYSVLYGFIFLRSGLQTIVRGV